MPDQETLPLRRVELKKWRTSFVRQKGFYELDLDVIYAALDSADDTKTFQFKELLCRVHPTAEIRQAFQEASASQVEQFRLIFKSIDTEEQLQKLKQILKEDQPRFKNVSNSLSSLLLDLVDLPEVKQLQKSGVSQIPPKVLEVLARSSELRRFLIDQSFHQLTTQEPLLLSENAKHFKQQLDQSLLEAEHDLPRVTDPKTSETKAPTQLPLIFEADRNTKPRLTRKLVPDPVALEQALQKTPSEFVDRDQTWETSKAAVDDDFDVPQLQPKVTKWRNQTSVFSEKTEFSPGDNSAPKTSATSVPIKVKKR